MIRSPLSHPGRLVLLVPALVIGACGGDFDPFNRIQALRVLAIRSEPVSPQVGETTELDALIYTPDRASVRHSWSWCPVPGSANQGYPCAVSESQLEMLGLPKLSFDLGQEPSAHLNVALAPAVLSRLCQGAAGSGFELDCSEGFPIQIKLTASTDDDQVIAVRTLRLRFDPSQAANQNPKIGALSASIGGQIVPFDGTVLPRKIKTKIFAAAPATDPEVRTRMDDQGNSLTGRERLILTWFVETGETKFERTNFIDGSVGLDQALTNEWEPGATKDYPRETARLLVVMRDDREGVTWTSTTARLGDTP